MPQQSFQRLFFQNRVFSVIFCSVIPVLFILLHIHTYAYHISFHITVCTFLLITSSFSQAICMEMLTVVDFNPAEFPPLLGCPRVSPCCLGLLWRIPSLTCSKWRRKLGRVCHIEHFFCPASYCACLFYGTVIMKDAGVDSKAYSCVPCDVFALVCFYFYFLLWTLLSFWYCKLSTPIASSRIFK